MYWSKFAERVQKKLSPPNINLYNKPPVAEVLLSKVDLSPNPKRKELFKGKLFVFLKEKDKKQLEDVIKKAGEYQYLYDQIFDIFVSILTNCTLWIQFHAVYELIV